MKILLSFFLLFFFIACFDEKTPAPKSTTQSVEVQLEKSDEKSELSDTNLPLPVEE
ncbi:cytochrome C [Campylobacter avium]|uniref:cytochrome C n=1 Tax=Campylobacter avium TaxID=522485 RepID=UPI0011D085AA|nr:cytochrome C [Campylobacter avium]HJE66416.1 cytochrome C [Campylobacter avium]